MVASYRLTFGASLLAALVNLVFGTIVAWVLVRYRFPGKKIVDVLVDLPFALPTAVAGIYGMNFEYMPELKAPWGYPVTLLAIGTVCSILYWRFRKSGWL